MGPGDKKATPNNRPLNFLDLWWSAVGASAAIALALWFLGRIRGAFSSFLPWWVRDIPFCLNGVRRSPTACIIWWTFRRRFGWHPLFSGFRRCTLGFRRGSNSDDGFYDIDPDHSSTGGG